MNDYLNIVPFEDCTGCSACLNSCPVGCILMSADGNGFRYPYVDRSSCINCSKCEGICPVHNVGEPNQPNSVFFGCKHIDDNVRRHSSSGGFFYELARNVISSGGVVFGVAFSDDFHKVVHVQALSLDELEHLRISKYVQSEVDSSFPLVKAALELGKTVLFSGTPCQIAGIKSYIGEVPDNLILAEVVCHGVPSPKVWDIYLSGLEKEHGSRVKYISFRDKSKSWRRSDFLALFENGKEFRQPNSENPYMKAFLLSLRPSCTRCRFKSFSSGADITMGDFWGSTEMGNSYNDDVGISVVALNTLKGRSSFDSVKDNLTGVVKLSEKQAFVFNESYRESAIRNPNDQKFISSIGDGIFESFVDDSSGQSESQKERLSSPSILKKALNLIHSLIVIRK